MNNTTRHDNFTVTRFSDNITNSSVPIATNSTSSDLSDYEKAALKFITWFALVVMLASIFVNGVCLIAFISEKRLRTVFNTYLICLTVTDFLYAALSMPNFIVVSYYENKWPLKANWCAFYLWTSWTLPATVQYTVMLISLDRIWALYFPFSYRSYRSRKVAYCCIAAMWLLLLFSIVPGIVINRMADNGLSDNCMVNMEDPGLRAWTIFVNFGNYIAPEAVVVVCFALMALRINKQSKIQAQEVKLEVRRRAGDLAGDSLAPSAHVPENSLAKTNSRADKDRRLFRMLGYIMLSMLICWMPGNVFWSMVDFDDNAYDFSLDMTTSLLMFANSVTNPILYQTGSNEMRRVLKQILRLKRPTVNDPTINRDRTLADSLSGRRPRTSSSRVRRGPISGEDV